MLFVKQIDFFRHRHQFGAEIDTAWTLNNNTRNYNGNINSLLGLFGKIS